MKIIELYIENFGRLSEFKATFTGGFDTICEENGFGKTTLSAFIKAMLYGLDDTKRTSLLENDRKRYLPWQGGAYGGYMVLEISDKKYRIERGFGAKASEDSFKLFDLETGLESKDYSNNIGIELLGIDQDGFERTVFLSEKNLSGKNENQTISAKLSDLVGVSGDIGDFDGALDILDKRRKYYRLNGGRGYIQDLESEKYEIESRISDAKVIANEKEKLEDLLKLESDALTSLAERKETLKKERQAAEEEAVMKVKLSAYQNYKNECEFYENKLRSYDEFFKKKLPTEEELDEISENCAELRRLKELRNSGIYDVYDKKDCPFAVIPNEEDYNKYKEMASFIPTKKGKASKTLPILGLILFGLGIALGLIVSYLLFAVSLIGIITAIIYPVLNKKYKKAYSSELQKYEKYRSLVYDFIFSVTGRPSSAEPLEALNDLWRSVCEYEKECLKRDALKEEKEKQNKEELQRIEQLARRIEGFLSLFPYSDDLSVESVRRALAEFHATQKTREEKRASALAYAKNNGIEGYEARSLRTTAEIDEEINITEATFKERQKNEDYAKAKLEAVHNTTREIGAMNLELSELEKKIEKAKENYKTITSAIALLKKSKENMTARYLKGAKDGFGKYMGIISQQEGDFSIDTSFSISKNDKGKLRPQEAYSKGTRDLYSLCIRLALSDALYETELPPLILDDPFLSFDDEKIEEGLKMLSEISKSRQIIYLTCSAARML